jgi:hypothetical protein
MGIPSFWARSVCSWVAFKLQVKESLDSETLSDHSKWPIELNETRKLTVYSLTLGKEAAKMVVEEREGHATATLIATAKLTLTRHLPYQFLVVLCDHTHSLLTPNTLYSLLRDISFPSFWYDTHSPQSRMCHWLQLSCLFVPPTSDARLVNLILQGSCYPVENHGGLL